MSSKLNNIYLATLDAVNKNNINIDNILFIEYYGTIKTAILNNDKYLFLICFKKIKGLMVKQKYYYGNINAIKYEIIFIAQRRAQNRKEQLPIKWHWQGIIKPEKIDCKKIKKLLLLS